ncbi:lysophospholipid acyltransferase family protein [Tundrisphaera sp. TA3]|uniref:lysophospholipid acyltransferase family protein n=1 Tax=Tundrisphaera sp. TA3 TaxID=3435775 RepID=UPI003EB7F9EA
MPHHWVGLQKHILRVILPILRLWPARLSAAFLDWIGWVDYALVPGQKDRYAEVVARARRELDRAWDDRAVARRLSSGLVTWRTRDRLLDGMSDRKALDRFIVHGKEHLDAALAEGRGAILLANHFGSHMTSSHWLFRQGYDLRLFSERPRNVSKYLGQQFRTDGPLGQEKLFISRRSTPTEAAGSILRASRVLKAGMVLKIASDVRWHGGHTAPGHFLGKTYQFSTTWIVLAAMTGAPIVPVFARPDDRGRYILDFLPSFHVPADAPRNGEASTYVQHALDLITEQVRLHPEQSNDYFYWTSPAASGVEAPRKQRPETVA